MAIANERGINGRKINFISYDDGNSPPKTVEMVRKLVERDQVLMDQYNMYGYTVGLTVNLWKSREEIASHWKLEHRFEPRMERKHAEAKLARWREAVSRSRNWARA